MDVVIVLDSIGLQVKEEGENEQKESLLYHFGSGNRAVPLFRS